MLSQPVILGHEDLSRDQLLLDRGLHYGDGLFETIAAVAGDMPLLEQHLARLSRDASQLLGHYPQALIEQRLQAVRQLLQSHSEPHVVKILITRGVSGRGYGYDPNTPLRVLAFIYPYQPPSLDKRLAGLNVIHCQHRLADRGWLGSIKHCNRLDQVVARTEVSQFSADEGLMYGDDGQLIEATSANVAVKLHGRWLTPEIAHIGIAGVARQCMIDAGTLTVANISRASLAEATALVLINSVQGIMPVRATPDRVYEESPEQILDELSQGLVPHMRGQW